MAKQKQLLVISSYPEKGSVHGKKTVGVASYTKNTLLALKKESPNLEITVLAEQFNKIETYQEQGILIKRIWKRNSFLSVVKIFKYLLDNREKSVLICFEGFMFGRAPFTGCFLASLTLAKILGSKNYLILHQVVEDFRKIEKNKIKAFFLNSINRLFQKTLLVSVSKIIVFEQHLAKVLGNNKKVVFIPHAIENVKPINQKTAQKQLKLNGENFQALYFGFLSPYKGVDLLIKNWPNDKNLKLILAGDGNPNHLKEKAYVNFVKKIKAEAQRKGVMTAGFVPEKEIGKFFSATNVVILPYQAFFSSSGPLSLAFAYLKPVLLSINLKKYLASRDFNQALKKAGLNPKDIFFNPKNKIDLKAKIINLKKKENKFKQLSSILKNERSWRKIAQNYLELLDLNQ